MSINTRNTTEGGLRKLLPHPEWNIHTKTKARVVRYPGVAVATSYWNPIKLDESDPDLSRLNFNSAAVAHGKEVFTGNAVSAEQGLAEVDQPVLLCAKSGAKQVLHLSVLVFFVLGGEIAHDTDHLMYIKRRIGLPARKRNCAVVGGNMID